MKRIGVWLVAILTAVALLVSSQISTVAQVGGGVFPGVLTSAGVTTALGYTPMNVAGDTMTGDLKFTDALFDIGKTGATRPRDGFFSRNVTVGSTLTATTYSGLPSQTFVATQYLSVNATVATAGVFVNGPTTGSIGANGQTWLIIAEGYFVNSSGGNLTATFGLNNGTADVANHSFSLTTGFGGGGALVAIVALTGATTFTLRATDNIGGSVGALQANAAAGTAGKATRISAVRLN